MSYLRYKWAIFFDIIDYNKDGILDYGDIDILEQNAVHLHNLTEREVRSNAECSTGALSYANNLIGAMK